MTRGDGVSSAILRDTTVLAPFTLPLLSYFRVRARDIRGDKGVVDWRACAHRMSRQIGPLQATSDPSFVGQAYPKGARAS